MKKRMKKKLTLSLSILLILFLSTGFAEAKVIKIGSIFPFTGQMGWAGEDARRALDFAMEEINNAGGIDGVNVEIIYEESNLTPRGGVSAAQKLIEIDKVNAIIGCLYSSVALAVKPIVEANKVVLIAPMASHPGLFKDNKYVFSLMYSYNDSAHITAKYNRQEMKKETLGILYMMNETGLAMTELLEKWWKYYGGKILIKESFSSGSTDFRTQLTKIRANSPDVLYLSVTPKEGAKVLKQFSEMNLKAHLATSNQIETNEFLELAGEAAEGLTYDTSFTEESKERKDFEKAFTAKYGQKPGIVAWNTYDSAIVLINSLKKAGSGGVGDKIRDSISKIDLQGVTGRIRFSEDGSLISGTSMWKVENGKFVPLNYMSYRPE